MRRHLSAAEPSQFVIPRCPTMRTIMNTLFVRLLLDPLAVSLQPEQTKRGVPGRILLTRNSLKDAVEPVYSVMRLFAAWPARRPRAGGWAALVDVLMLALQLLFLLLVGTEWLTVLDDRVRYMRSGAGVTRTVLAIQFLLYLCMFFTLPVIWRDAVRLAPVWERWGHLQARLERVSGGRLASSRQWSTRLAVLLLLLWPPLVAVPLMLLPEAEMPVRQAWFYAYPTLVTFSLKLLWLRLFTALRSAADLLVSSFEKDAAAFWTRPDSAARLRTYRELWSSMRDTMEDIGVLGGLSQLSVQAIQVLSLLICFVQVVMSCLQGFTPGGLWIVSLTLTNTTTLVTLSNAAHAVAHQMLQMRVTLETTPTVGLTSAVDYEIQVFRETLSYKAAAVRLCGFVTVDRELVGAVTVVLMTYLMVLLQFALL